MTTRTSPGQQTGRGDLAADVALGLAVALLLGAVVGSATSFAQARLPGAWASLANSASPWLLGAFVAGLVARRLAVAVAAGLLACVAEVAGYYLTTVVRGFAASEHEIVFWTACALVGGPFFGWAAWVWRHEPRRWWRATGAAAVPATFVGEAAGAYLWRLDYRADAVLFAAIGLLCLAASATPADVRARVIPPFLALTAIALLGYGPMLGGVTG